MRDPVEQQISRFYFWRVRHPDEYKKYSLIDNMTFDQCVSKLDWPIYNTMFDPISCLQNRSVNCINLCFLSINYMTRHLGGISDICHYKILNSTKTVDKAIDNLNTYFDFVGIVEYYDQSWKYFTKKFKIQVKFQ